MYLSIYKKKRNPIITALESIDTFILNKNNLKKEIKL